MNEYQVGGSLNVDADSYVTRLADSQLYEALLQGHFCYVFNCRQMGKSSLRVRVKNRLEKKGYACVSLDMTNIGSNSISPKQWYKSIASELWRGFNLIGKVKFKAWWEEHQELSSIQQLDRFISDVILPTIEADKIFIFIDEIDSVISLDFSTDDFFALIRYFYNQRAEKAEFNRLGFALFGVATPSDLISDRTRTPFNIGKAIELTGFTPQEATPLIAGLHDGFKNPQLVIEEIVKWSGGQPFLTQKLCKIVIDCSEGMCDCPLPGCESEWIEKIVQEQVIDSWESQDEPEHLKTIRDRLLRDQSKAARLLRIVEQIFKQGFVYADESIEQRYLLLSNLVVKRNGQLIYRNAIYHAIFDLDWIKQQLDQFCPYGKELNLWLASGGEDTSFLLRGNTLKQAQIWAENHDISIEEYQFVNASQAREQQESLRNIELSRLQEVESRLLQEQKLAKLQRFYLGTVSTALLATIALGIGVYWNYRQAKIQKTEAHIASAKSLFNSDRRFNSLIEAIRAKQEVGTIVGADSSLINQANLVLQQATYNLTEKNTFIGHQDILFGADFSSDGQTIATASADTTIKIWQRDGKLLHTLKNHSDTVLDVAFSPDGKTIASASEDETIKLWNSQGELLKTLRQHSSSVNRVLYNPQGDMLASASEDSTVRLWNREGRLLHVLSDHQSGVVGIAFSNDGQLIATGDRTGVLKLWNSNGKLLRTINAHKSPLRGIDFALQGNQIVTGGDDNVAKIWDLQGNLIKILSGYTAPVTTVKISPDGKTIGTASWDNTVKLWSLDGTLVSNFKGHQGRIWRMSWSPDSKYIVTAGWDNVAKLWQLDNSLVNTFYGHTSSTINVVFHPNSKFIASASVDGTVKLWNSNGNLITDFRKHTNEVRDVAFSNDGELLVSTSYDRTIKLWRADGRVLDTYTNDDTVTDIRFAPKGFIGNENPIMVSGGFDTKIRFWEIEKSANKIKTIAQKTISAHEARISDIDVSQDGQLIASVAHDRYLKLWKSDGKFIRSVLADKIGARTVSISPDQELIATGGKEKNVKLWNMEGELVNTLEGHSAIVLDVEFSPDSSKIATASADNIVKIWNRNGKLLTTLQGHQGRVWDVEFSPDGKKVASASEDKQVKLWNLEKILQIDTLEYGCNWIEDYLRTNPEVTEQNLCR